MCTCPWKACFLLIHIYTSYNPVINEIICFYNNTSRSDHQTSVLIAIHGSGQECAVLEIVVPLFNNIIIFRIAYQYTILVSDINNDQISIEQSNNTKPILTDQNNKCKYYLSMTSINFLYQQSGLVTYYQNKGGLPFIQLRKLGLQNMYIENLVVVQNSVSAHVGVRRIIIKQLVLSIKQK